MRVGLYPVDSKHFPNYALAKLSAWHKSVGDEVFLYDPKADRKPDILFVSKVFTFSESPPLPYNDCYVVKGGTGYRDYDTVLPDFVDQQLPDLSLFPQYDYSYGFLSRGCIRRCSFCVVPRKEGQLRRYDDIQRVAQGRKFVKLMDNNFLANDRDFVREQLGVAHRMGIRLDFNQGLDARLVDDENAFWLARCKWKPAIRFACDHQSVLPYLRFAVYMLRIAGYTGEVFCYVLAKELEESLDRVKRILSIDRRIVPFVQPWRDLDGDGEIKDPALRKLARWCNRVAIRKTCTFEEYQNKDEIK
jgi:hypothetical protein